MPYVVLVHATFANKSDADHIYDQAKAVAVNASVANIGQPKERTSYVLVAQEQEDGKLVADRTWHLDIFGIVRDGEPQDTESPDWVQPAGAHDAYPAFNVRGNKTTVTHNGQVWENIHGNANVWEPGAHGWQVVVVEEPDEEPDDGPDENPDENPDEEPDEGSEGDSQDAPAAWVQPVGGHDAYTEFDGDGNRTTVTHNGQIWENVHGDGNAWEPGVHGWQVVV